MRPEAGAVPSDQGGAGSDQGLARCPAQTQYLETDLLGAFPAFLLVIVLVLALLGVVAHVAFV